MARKWFSLVMAVLMVAGVAITASAGTLEEIAQRGELRVVGRRKWMVFMAGSWGKGSEG